MPDDADGAGEPLAAHLLDRGVHLHTSAADARSQLERNHVRKLMMSPCSDRNWPWKPPRNAPSKPATLLDVDSLPKRLQRSMVHLRLNDPDTSRNPFINFITPLPHFDDANKARRLLAMLAAQVKPIMKQHAFEINSFEEYEVNPEFAGRNWEAGETIELVLRRADGAFLPTNMLLMVLIHELAHIRHMNHSLMFHRFNDQLREEVKALQRKGYFGDGFWSAGRTVDGTATVAGEGLGGTGDFPRYVCGGAFRRPKSYRRGGWRRAPYAGSKRKRRVSQGPSLHTGAQVSTRKPGRRVKKDFGEGGVRLDGKAIRTKENAAVMNKDPDSTFRKSAKSATARELRANAALARMAAAIQRERNDEKKPGDLFHSAHQEEPKGKGKKAWDWDVDSKAGLFGEAHAGSLSAEGSDGGSNTDDDDDDDDGGFLIDDFQPIPPDVRGHGQSSDIPSSSTHRPSNGNEREEDLSTKASGETSAQRQARLEKGMKREERTDLGRAWADWLALDSSSSTSNRPSELIGGGGAGQGTPGGEVGDDSETDEEEEQAAVRKSEAKRRRSCGERLVPPSVMEPGLQIQSNEWSCAVCTMVSHDDFARCSACGTKRGSEVYDGDVIVDR